MEAPLRRSAPGNGIQKNIPDVINRNEKLGIGIGKSTQYEHAVSLQEINSRIAESYNKAGKLNDNVWNGYHVNVVSNVLNKAMDNAGFQTQQSPFVGDTRMYNPGTLRWLVANNGKTLSDGTVVNLKDIDVIEYKDGTIDGQDVVDAIKAFDQAHNIDPLGLQTIGKAVRLCYS